VTRTITLILVVAAMWACSIALVQRDPLPAAAAAAIPVAAGESALLEAQARQRCARDRGDNAGYILLADGVLVCTDKHGRRARNEITVARKTTP
jgi:hypothetical protein